MMKYIFKCGDKIITKVDIKAPTVLHNPHTEPKDMYAKIIFPINYNLSYATSEDIDITEYGQNCIYFDVSSLSSDSFHLTIHDEFHQGLREVKTGVMVPEGLLNYEEPFAA